MKIKINNKKMIRGSMFLIIGLIFATSSLSYRIGTVLRMGPGFFPLMLSTVLICIGLVSILSFDSNADKIGLAPNELKTLITVVLASIALSIAVSNTLGFGMLIGIPVSVIALETLGAGFSWKSVVYRSIVLSALTYVLFIKLLGVNLAM